MLYYERRNSTKTISLFALCPIESKPKDSQDFSIIKKLTEIRGVGVWTAKMILIFQLQRPDVFPREDLAIRQIISLLYRRDEDAKNFKEDAEKIAARWKPYRTIASLYLWSYKRSLINKAS
ncbi:MAG: DNA-3-methyladenine glycosylase family protein [Saprospiraceae bacterium]|jgi:DNA-3-methyladenine glycosylase II